MSEPMPLMWIEQANIDAINVVRDNNWSAGGTGIPLHWTPEKIDTLIETSWSMTIELLAIKQAMLQHDEDTRCEREAWEEYKKTLPNDYSNYMKSIAERAFLQGFHKGVADE